MIGKFTKVMKKTYGFTDLQLLLCPVEVKFDVEAFEELGYRIAIAVGLLLD